MKTPIKLRSAHAFIGKNRHVIVAQNWQTVVSEATGARVVFNSSRFHRAGPKPSLKGVLEALGQEAT